MTERWEKTGAFTLLELLLVLILISSILMIGIPSWQSIRESQRALQATNQLMSAIQDARSMAISQQIPICIRPASGLDWASGQVIFINTLPPKVLRHYPAIPKTHIEWHGFRSHQTYLEFLPFGILNYQNGRFIYRSDTGLLRDQRVFIVNRVGRVYRTREPQ